jgi:hypothetical protein
MTNGRPAAIPSERRDESQVDATKCDSGDYVDEAPLPDEKGGA